MSQRRRAAARRAHEAQMKSQEEFTAGSAAIVEFMNNFTTALAEAVKSIAEALASHAEAITGERSMTPDQWEAAAKLDAGEDVMVMKLNETHIGRPIAIASEWKLGFPEEGAKFTIGTLVGLPPIKPGPDRVLVVAMGTAQRDLALPRGVHVRIA